MSQGVLSQLDEAADEETKTVRGRRLAPTQSDAASDPSNLTHYIWKWYQEVRKRGQGMTFCSRHFGIHRRTFARWLRGQLPQPKMRERILNTLEADGIGIPDSIKLQE